MSAENNPENINDLKYKALETKSSFNGCLLLILSPLIIIFFFFFILSLVAIPEFPKITLKARASAVKNGLTNGVKECSIRGSKKLSTTFSDSLSFSHNYDGYKIQFINIKSCFQAKAIPEDSKETWFKIEMDEITGKVSKKCGDSSKPGCEEGNTW